MPPGFSGRQTAGKNDGGNRPDKSCAGEFIVVGGIQAAADSTESGRDVTRAIQDILPYRIKSGDSFDLNFNRS